MSLSPLVSHMTSNLHVSRAFQPPSQFPMTSLFGREDHHLSGPSIHSFTQTALNQTLLLVPTATSHNCMVKLVIEHPHKGNIQSIFTFILCHIIMCSKVLTLWCEQRTPWTVFQDGQLIVPSHISLHNTTQSERQYHRCQVQKHRRNSNTKDAS